MSNNNWPLHDALYAWREASRAQRFAYQSRKGWTDAECDAFYEDLILAHMNRVAEDCE